jgi:hypothetical protein
MIAFAVLTCLLLISCSAVEREFKEAVAIDAIADWELVFVQQLWRHGDRSPINSVNFCN